jgi:hypothetical protein
MAKWVVRASNQGRFIRGLGCGCAWLMESDSSIAKVNQSAKHKRQCLTAGIRDSVSIFANDLAPGEERLRG